MKSPIAVLSFLALLASPVAGAQNLTTAQVLANMDQKAKAFTSLEASIVNAQVEYGVRHPEGSGKIYMRRAPDSAPRLFWDITAPANDRKTFLIDRGILRAYLRSTNQFTERNVGVDSDVLALLLIGFGTPSEIFSKSYAPEYKGWETVGGVQAAVLELTARDEKAEHKKITLWLAPTTWTPVQTRVAQSAKSYTDFRYSNTRLNRGVPDSVFKLDVPKDARKP